MAQQLDQKELATFEELLRSNLIEMDALASLLLEKGVFTQQEFHARLKEFQYEYESKRAARA